MIASIGSWAPIGTGYLGGVRLLFVCGRLPWPSDGGSALRTAALVRALAERAHEVELLAFGRTVDSPAHNELASRVAVTLVESPGEGSAADWLRDAGQSSLPWMVRQRTSAAMSAAVRARSAEADVVVATTLSMVQYLDDVRGPLRVYDAHDVESSTLAQVARLGAAPTLSRFHAAREASAVERYERDLAARVDLAVTVTDADASALSALAPALAVATVPIGVVVGDHPPLWRPGPPRLAFFGDLGWPPNADAAVHLCHDVLPLVEGRPLVTIAGRRPGRELRALARPGVEVTGAVPVMADVLGGDTIAVAPLRAGTGMRVKLLQAMAWSLPAVASPIGCAGIEHEGAIVEVEGPAATAAALSELLADVERRREIGERGRGLVTDRYGHETSGARLVAAIERTQVEASGASRR
jgi:glycosyltransferase involved in cell wall biosynthesis